MTVEHLSLFRALAPAVCPPGLSFLREHSDRRIRLPVGISSLELRVSRRRRAGREGDRVCIGSESRPWLK